MSLSAASERNFPIWSSSLEYVDRAAGYVHELLMHFSSIKWAKEVWILLCFQYVQWSLFCFLSLILWENLHVYMYMNHYYFWLQHRSWIFDEAVIYLKTIIIIFYFIFLPFLFLLSFRRIYFSHLLNMKPLWVKMSLLKSCSWNWSDRKS